MNPSITKVLNQLAKLKRATDTITQDDPRDPRTKIQLPRQQLSLIPFLEGSNAA